MAWTKLHTDILADPKLLRAERLGARHIVYLPWLFAFAKKADDEGRLTVGGVPAEPADIAPLIPNCSEKRIEKCLAELEKIEILIRDDDNALRFASWELRAVDKPSDSKEARADRQRRHRDRKRQKRQGDTKNDANASHALQGVTDVTPRHAPEEKRGEENKKRRDISSARDRAADDRTYSPHDHAAGFDEAWALYPKRAGGNPKHDALKQWRARRKKGTTAETMIAGTRRYAAFCEATSKAGTEYVMQAKRFFGPTSYFDEPWDAPEPSDDDLPPEWRGLDERAAAEDARAEADALWLAQRGDGDAP